MRGVKLIARSSGDPSRDNFHLSPSPVSHRRRLAPRRAGADPARARPRDRRDARRNSARDPRGPRRRAGRRGARIRRLAQDFRVRPLEADAPRRRYLARARQLDRLDHDPRTGQTARAGENGSAGRRGHDRLVRRGSAPRLWPSDPRPRAGRAADHRQAAGRAGRGVHAVELSDQSGRAQTLRRARDRLFDHRQGAGGDARLPDGTDPRVSGRRSAGGRDRSGLWNPR